MKARARRDCNWIDPSPPRRISSRTNRLPAFSPDRSKSSRISWRASPTRGRGRLIRPIQLIPARRGGGGNARRISSGLLTAVPPRFLPLPFNCACRSAAAAMRRTLRADFACVFHGHIAITLSRVRLARHSYCARNAARQAPEAAANGTASGTELNVAAHQNTEVRPPRTMLETDLGSRWRGWLSRRTRATYVSRIEKCISPLSYSSDLFYPDLFTVDNDTCAVH